MLHKIILLLLITSAFCACKKQEIPVPAVTQQTTALPMESPIGINYTINDAVFYLRNVNTDELQYFNHFSAGQLISALDPFTGPAIPFDSIIKNGTQWLFAPNGNMILNNQYNYPYNIINNTLYVYGMNNGSARPIEVLRCGGDYLNVKVLNSYVTLNNIDYEFYSIISLVKTGSTNAFSEPIFYGANYSGVIASSLSPQQNLTGTNWVITQYISQITSVNPNDTIHFLTPNTYRINSGSTQNYTLSYITGTGMRSLTLYNCSTLGGSYAGQLLNAFDIDGFANDIKCRNLYTNQLIRVWINKI